MLFFRYHFLFCALLNCITSYRSFGAIIKSLRVSKVKGEAHHRRFFLLRHRKAEQEVRSHNTVIRVFIVLLYYYLFVLPYSSLPRLFAFELSEEVSPYNRPFLVFKT